MTPNSLGSADRFSLVHLGGFCVSAYLLSILLDFVVHGQKLSSLHFFAYRMIPVYDARLFYGYFFYSMGFKTSFSGPLMG